MKLAWIAAALLTASAAAAAGFSPESTLWLDHPARQFTESLPLGNGRLGAMDFGGIADERIVLNEDSLWSGSVQDADRPEAWKALPEIRRLLLAGKNHEAETLVNQTFTCAGRGSGNGRGGKLPYGSYQVLGNLRLTFPLDRPQTATGYRRELDLATALGRTTFTLDGVRYTREIFVSAPDQAVVLRLTADQPGRITFTAALDRPERFQTRAVSPAELLMTGALTNGVDGDGVTYAARLRVRVRGGAVTAADDTLRVTGADAATLLLTAATDYQRYARLSRRDTAAAAARDLQAAAAKSYAALRAAQLADYQSLYDRAALHLAAPAATQAIARRPTPDRIAAMKLADDPALAVLYFNYGRYLFIACSRPGGLPANLQGLWADTIAPPWSADYHLNINLEMIYWPAEVCNLSALNEPLFSYIESLTANGARTARAYYRADGWVAHVLANAWDFTSPGESAAWGSTATDGAWLCHNLWEHWSFTRDTNYLRRVYPVLRGSAQFYRGLLIEEPTHHWLVTAPANSPENAFIMPDGRPAHICLGPTFDNQLLRFLFGACAQAAGVLGVDPGLAAEWQAVRDRLPPTRIAPDGRVMEWLQNYPEQDPRHRHTSHLWGLYPGNEISVDGTPALAAAARLSLLARGDESTGWATAFRLGMWARLHDGAHAFRLLQNLIKPAAGRQPGGAEWTGGCYPNLFDAHPPFQIDGNLGGAAAIAELFVQSQNGVIELLPALPPQWPRGAVRGLRARGGYEVSVQWQDGRLQRATLANVSGAAACQVAYAGRTRTVTLPAGATRTLTAADF